MFLWASRDVQHALCCLLFFFVFFLLLSCLFSFLSALVSHSTKINKEREWEKGLEIKSKGAFNCHLVFLIFVCHSLRSCLTLLSLKMSFYWSLKLQFPTATMSFLLVYSLYLHVLNTYQLNYYNNYFELCAQVSVCTLRGRKQVSVRKSTATTVLWICSRGLNSFHFGCTFPCLKNNFSFHAASRNCKKFYICVQ